MMTTIVNVNLSIFLMEKFILTQIEEAVLTAKKSSSIAWMGQMAMMGPIRNGDYGDTDDEDNG